MSQPNTTSQKPKPPSTAEKNLSLCRYLPRRTPSMSATATLTRWPGSLRTASSTLLAAMFCGMSSLSGWRAVYGLSAGGRSAIVTRPRRPGCSWQWHNRQHESRHARRGHTEFPVGGVDVAARGGGAVWIRRIVRQVASVAARDDRARPNLRCRGGAWRAARFAQGASWAVRMAPWPQRRGAGRALGRLFPGNPVGGRRHRTPWFRDFSCVRAAARMEFSQAPYTTRRMVTRSNRDARAGADRPGFSVVEPSGAGGAVGRSFRRNVRAAGGMQSRARIAARTAGNRILAKRVRRRLPPAGTGARAGDRDAA